MLSFLKAAKSSASCSGVFVLFVLSFLADIIKLLPFLVTNDKGDFRDFANWEILDRLQEQKGVTRPSCPKDKRFERAVNVGFLVSREMILNAGTAAETVELRCGFKQARVLSICYIE